LLARYHGIVLGLEYIELAPGFVREVVDVYDAWEGRESVPMKIQELMMVLRIEVTKLYDPGSWARQAEMPKVPTLRDTKLG